MIEIIYIIKRTGVRVTEKFYHPDSAERRWKQLNRSKEYQPVSYVPDESLS